MTVKRKTKVKQPIETIKIDLGFYKLASELGKKKLSYGDYKSRMMDYVNKKKK